MKIRPEDIRFYQTNDNEPVFALQARVYIPETDKMVETLPVLIDYQDQGRKPAQWTNAMKMRYADRLRELPARVPEFSDVPGRVGKPYRPPENDGQVVEAVPIDMPPLAG
jgi:hypothetical protein